MEYQHSSLITLRQVLTQDKPKWNILVDFSKHAGHLSDRNKVHIWSGFSLRSINAVCGEFLDRPFPRSNIIIPNPTNYLAGHQVRDAKDISNMACWLQDNTAATVRFAAAALGFPVGGHLIFHAAEPDLHWDGVDHWYGIQNGNLFKSLAVGLTFTNAGVFDIEEIRTGRGNDRWTCRQLELLRENCAHHKTNYGFMVTDTQLVLVHCTADMTPEGQVFGYRVMPVPLYGTGPNGLTAELALWAFCMLALVHELASRGNGDGGAGEDTDELIAQFQSVLG